MPLNLWFGFKKSEDENSLGVVLRNIDRSGALVPFSSPLRDRNPKRSVDSKLPRNLKLVDQNTVLIKGHMCPVIKGHLLVLF